MSGLDFFWEFNVSLASLSESLIVAFLVSQLIVLTTAVKLEHVFSVGTEF